MVQIPVLTLSLTAHEQLNLFNSSSFLPLTQTDDPRACRQREEWCVQRSFTRETKACARLSALGDLSTLRRKELVFLPYSFGGAGEILVTNVTMREEGGGPGERHQRGQVGSHRD